MATATLVRAVNAYLNTKAATTQRVTSYVQSSWNNLDSYRDSDILRFANRVAPVVEGAQANIGALTNVYLANIEAELIGSPVRPVALSKNLFTTEALRGVTAKEAFQRPGLTIWTGLSEGKPLSMLINKGLSRALDITRTNLQLASTHSARANFKNNQRVVGYRRVLSGSDSCSLCELASSQRYHVEDLMPIHPGCSCGVSPIYGHADPGQVIDSQRRSNTDDIEIVVKEHGEIGPVLAVKGQAFTSAGDI